MDRLAQMESRAVLLRNWVMVLWVAFVSVLGPAGIAALGWVARENHAWAGLLLVSGAQQWPIVTAISTNPSLWPWMVGTAFVLVLAAVLVTGFWRRAVEHIRKVYKTAEFNEQVRDATQSRAGSRKHPRRTP